MSNIEICLATTSYISIKDAPPFISMIPNIDISVLKQVLISLKYFELIPIRYD
jgi:hypothetical protein